jgi:hypothetical protein
MFRPSGHHRLYQITKRKLQQQFQLQTNSKILLFTVAIGLIIRARDSSVGIATRYGLDGPGIESRWR